MASIASIDCSIASQMVKDGNDAGWIQWLLAFRVVLNGVWFQTVVLNLRHISNRLTHGWVVWWTFNVRVNEIYLKFYDFCYYNKIN